MSLDNSRNLDQIVLEMRAAKSSEHSIKVFSHYFMKLARQESFLIPEEQISPVEDLPVLGELAGFEQAGIAAMGQVMLIKLNGGLGTSMGLSSAKSLIKVKDGLSFLDLIARQIIHGRKSYGAQLSLVLMNSFYTESDSIALLYSKYPEVVSGSSLPLSFLQNKVPKLDSATLLPVKWPNNRELEWCPPGHGDIYPSLWERQIIKEALDAGIRYAFISNADNLGAVISPTLLGYMVEQKLPFVMEVAKRTPSDRKGGHLAQLASGQLVLRERAQCPPDQIEAFEDIKKYSYFNTNSLWINLEFLADILDRQEGLLDLPLIRNEKNVDPEDSASPLVYQLETAVGSAISVFEGAGAVEVPRDRFLPVKTTSDLLTLWSDRYQLQAGCYLEKRRECIAADTRVSLDRDYFQSYSQFQERFANGAPSLAECSELTVKGDVFFGKEVRCRGKVVLENSSAQPLLVPDGTLLE